MGHLRLILPKSWLLLKCKVVSFEIHSLNHYCLQYKSHGSCSFKIKILCFEIQRFLDKTSKREHVPMERWFIKIYLLFISDWQQRPS